MPAERVSMRQARDIIRLKFSTSLPTREIARRLGLARSTVRETLSRLESAGLSWPLPEGIGDTELEAALYANRRSKRGHRRHADWSAVHRELKRSSRSFMMPDDADRWRMASVPAGIAAHRCAARSPKPMFWPSPKPSAAQRTALEVLAGNHVHTVIQQNDGVMPTPVISRAILIHNRGRSERLADGVVVTPMTFQSCQSLAMDAVSTLVGLSSGECRLRRRPRRLIRVNVSLPLEMSQLRDGVLQWRRQHFAY